MADQSQSATSKPVGFIPDWPYDYIRMFVCMCWKDPHEQPSRGACQSQRQLRVCFTPSRKSWWI